MSLATVVAAIMFSGVLAYAVFAGADFGSGVWDLTAGGPERGAPMRSLIDDSIGPVWEANHVWLVFVLVYLWTAFPQAFAAICETLFVPLTLAGFGIVLRGSAFAFRKFAPNVAEARLFGAIFASSSVLTPFFFGAVVGAVASGRVPLDGSGHRWRSWMTQTSLVGGVLAVLTTAFLAAVFLMAEAERQGNLDLVAACRRRALGSGIVTGVAALVGIVPLDHDAPLLFHRLTGRALPVVLVSAVAGCTSLALVWRGRPTIARVAAVVAVGSVVAGWGLAQYPWVLVEAAHIDDIAAPRSTLWSLVVVFALAAVTVFPALAYLYWLTQRRGLGDESAPDQFGGRGAATHR
jgi:cytochrome d ubiquinol oxidase subunit II